MAEFPANSNNGEFYLRHDLFSRQSPALIGPFDELLPVEDLPNAAQYFGPVYLPHNGFGLGVCYNPRAFGRSGAGFGSAVIRPGPRPVHPPYLFKSHQAQLEDFVHAGLPLPNPALNRSMPFRFGFGPGLKRGTGFFLPKAFGNSDAKRKQNKRNGGYAPPMRNGGYTPPMRNAGKQAIAGKKTSSAGLPKDWPY